MPTMSRPAARIIRPCHFYSECEATARYVWKTTKLPSHGNVKT
jgi:hypothetical protein